MFRIFTRPESNRASKCSEKIRSVDKMRLRKILNLFFYRKIANNRKYFTINKIPDGRRRSII